MGLVCHAAQLTVPSTLPSCLTVLKDEGAGVVCRPGSRPAMGSDGDSRGGHTVHLSRVLPLSCLPNPNLGVDRMPHSMDVGDWILEEGRGVYLFSFSYFDVAYPGTWDIAIDNLEFCTLQPPPPKRWDSRGASHWCMQCWGSKPGCLQKLLEVCSVLRRVGMSCWLGEAPPEGRLTLEAKGWMGGLGKTEQRVVKAI